VKKIYKLGFGNLILLVEIQGFERKKKKNEGLKKGRREIWRENLGDRAVNIRLLRSTENLRTVVSNLI
ncbi:MAG: hypothetical protein Q8847_02480, partial [Sweet potato little leaf phytoplasma]|nr:hypothetical protein [Sweet potato little leaf phytoplasma]